MKTIFKYLKFYGWLIILCIMLLYGQAMSDLSLPNLMSDIVNVGIQQSGIDVTAPKAISKNGLDLLKFFMTESDKQIINSNYTLIVPDSAQANEIADEYPLVKTEAIYQLNALTAEQENKTGEIFSKAAYAFMNYVKAQPGAQGNESSTASNTNIDIDFEKLYQMLPVFARMPAGQFSDSISSAQTADIAFTKQVGIAFIKIFYKEIGIDTAKIQDSYIIKKGLYMLLITLLGAAASISVGFFGSKIAAGVAKKMRHDVFKKVENFSSHEFDQFSTASLITRSTNDVTQVQMLVNMGIRLMCYAPILAVGGIIMAVRKSLSLSWIIAVAVLTLIGVITVIFSIAMPKFKIIQKLIDKLNLVTRESLSGMMVIRAFGNQKHEEERFEKANRDLTETNLFVNRVMVFMMPFMMFLMNAMTLAVVWIGGHQIADSLMQVGDMMAFMQYAMQIIFSFLMIAMMFIMVPRAAVSATRIGEVLDIPLSITDTEYPMSFGPEPQGEIIFDHVCFRYDNAESDVLHDINFTAKPAQTTAIIGSTGSGKSTLINLIPRFYDVTEGSITINGVDIRDVSQKSLHNIIGYIPQKGVLFSGDIESNILYGKENSTIEEVKLAAEIAQATEFIDSNEKKYQTDISQGGTNVSGGQKQRLAIARALIKKAPIYIFDDSFSALDFKTDVALRKALKKYTGDSTVLIVAQRVSTIIDADQIIVLEEGKIAGIGTHKQLMEKCEVYKEIAESQLSKEELS